MLIGDVLDAESDHNGRRINYGERSDGPWVFGISEKDSRRFRMFFVANRKRDTLFPTLKNIVDANSIINSDGWAAYKGLDENFAGHLVVNHRENFVDPQTGARTQKIECLWGHVKQKVLKCLRGVPVENLQSHLDMFCYLYQQKEISCPFEFFMGLLKNL